MISSLDIIREFLTTSVSAPATSTLSAAITTTTATSFTVASGTGFRSEGRFAVKIDSEWILVTRSGTTFTVEAGGRGIFGTTAATHSNGATVSQGNLYLACGTNIAVKTWPEGFGNTYPLVVIEPEGGDSDNYIERFDGSYTFKCFSGSASHKECEVLGGLLYDRLQKQANQILTTGCLQYAYADGPVDVDWEIEPEWEMALLGFEIETRETANTGA